MILRLCDNMCKLLQCPSRLTVAVTGCEDGKLLIQHPPDLTGVQEGAEVQGLIFCNYWNSFGELSFYGS